MFALAGVLFYYLLAGQFMITAAAQLPQSLGISGSPGVIKVDVAYLLLP